MNHEKNRFIHIENCFKGRKEGLDKEKVAKTMGEEQRDTWIDDMGRVHNVIVYLGCEIQSELLPISLTESLPLEKKRCHLPSVEFSVHC